MIFPGMDPYLEDPALWPGFHNSLIVYMRDQLHPQLRPRYIASIEERVQAYEAGGYEDLLDYAAPCRPPLSADDQIWADEQIATRRG